MQGCDSVGMLALLLSLGMGTGLGWMFMVGDVLYGILGEMLGLA